MTQKIEPYIAALDVSGTLWEDRRDERPYPLYGAFMEIGASNGVISEAAMDGFPRLPDGTVDWERKQDCVRIYRSILPTLEPDIVQSVLEQVEKYFVANPNIPGLVAGYLRAIRDDHPGATFVVFSETQSTIVQAYIGAVNTTQGLGLSPVFGSQYEVDTATGRLTGKATRLQKASAAAAFLAEAGLSRFNMAMGDSVADEALFAVSARAVAYNPNRELHDYPGLVVLGHETAYSSAS